MSRRLSTLRFLTLAMTMGCNACHHRTTLFGKSLGRL